MGKWKMRQRKVVAAAVATVVALVLAGPVAAFAAVQTNYAWYKGNEAQQSYVIGTAGELKALAKLVNGTADYDGDGKVDAAVSFEGKTVTLSSGLSANFMGEAIEPIGTQAHPFQGTFDGSERQVDNFNLTIDASSTASVRNVGLFGYVGAKGKLVGVSVGPNASISITRGASSTDYIENVGMVAGYCGGTMVDCSNAGHLTVTSEVVQKSKDDFLPVRNVGGVVGQCVFDMTGCHNAGAVSVSELSSPVAAFARAQLVARVGGVAGLLGDESRIGSYDKHVYGDPAKHGSMDSCTNVGQVFVDTPKLAGLDRFSQETQAESVYVGGVVGYSQGSVTNCTNGRAAETQLGADGRDVGYVNAQNGLMVGGVCGALRGVMADNMNIAYADDGADGNDPLVLSHCANYGDVYGRVTVGGVVGKSSSYTSVVQCLNSTKTDWAGNTVGTYVVATRWNKPGPGGIVGTSNGQVSYCANLGTVASGTWSNEETRTIATQDGYYAAGIVGMLTYFDDQAVAHGGVMTPISEVYSCYNAGTIVAGANMRQRGIVGENDGYVHDNVLLQGVVYNDEMVYGDDADESEASGAVGENRLYSAAELRGDKSAEAVAFLNSNSQANGWEHYFVVPPDNKSTGLNAGYPLLNSQDPWGDDAVLLTGAQVSLAADAPYTGGESVPSAVVKLDGATLVENADYRVVPQQGAVDPSTGKKYRAQIVGLGRYRGTADQQLAYDVVAGDFGSCSLTVAAHTFDYSAQVPAESDVTVRTPAGTTVDPAEYTFQLVDGEGAAIEPPVDADTYLVRAVPKEGSALFTGEAKGTFRIKPASFMREVTFEDVTVEHLGKTWPWVDSKTKGEADNPSTTLAYTGAPVKPVVSAISYKGHELKEGTDYTIVYGNANSDDGYPGDEDATNMGRKGGKSVGCVTIRYISGRKTNFTSYSNMFFNIVDDGSKVDLQLARYEVEGEQLSDGRPLEPVELYLGKAKLARGTDYDIEYRDNVKPGTAHFLATGRGTFTGMLEGDFEIGEGTSYELSYEFAGTGAEDDPYEATVTGVAYKGARDSFDLVIPDTVQHDGHDYAVVAIGDGAFGGRSLSDFSGSAENESKMKIASVFVPASVRTLGECAFGTASITLPSKPPVSAVEFGAGSQLTSIGDFAFSKCASLKTLTLPAGVETLGKCAFQDCTALTELRFLTEDAKLPSDVAAGSLDGAFNNCTGVVVRGFEGATAVKELAQDNADAKKKGTHGGKGFTFRALASISGAEVSAVADQMFTGAEVRPQATVQLDGRTLEQGRDYELAYEDNVNAGTARVVARGIGDMGGQAVREFRISPAKIAQATFARVPDQEFTGQPVDLQARLQFNGRTLVQDEDYELSYADLAGDTVDAPAAAGSYRLVVTGTGNFEGTTYRSFAIAAPSLDDAVVGSVGDQRYTGAPLEPDLDVTVGGVRLERGRDYVVSFSGNVDVGQAEAAIYGVGSYEGQAQASFRIVAASLEGATVAGVADVKATGSPVSFHPVVVVGGVPLSDGDFTVSYAVRKAAGSRQAPSGRAALAVAGAAVAVQADGDDDYEALDSAPAEVGSYRLVVTGKGRYSGTAHADFQVTAGEPAATTDLSSATVTLETASFAYDGTAHAPTATVSLGAAQLVEGRDFVMAYDGNVDAGATGGATATAWGLGSYSGSATASFTVAPATITAESVQAVADVMYAAAPATPHPVVTVGGRTLYEGTDFAVAYANNDAPGRASLTITAQGGNYATDPAAGVVVEFGIAKADVSGALVDLDYRSTAYTGSELRPAVTVWLGKRQLDQSQYSVDYADNVNPGTATVTVTARGDYAEGEATATFAITPLIVPKPVAAAGQVYTGAAQDGFARNEGYAVTGTARATAVGTYTATVAPAPGYAWQGGFSSPVQVTWTIAPASLAGAKVALSKVSFTYNGKVQRPAVTVSLGGTVVPAAGYAASVPASKAGGTYVVTVTGRGNYAGTATATYKIAPAAQKLVAKAKKPAVKAAKLKKAKQVVKLASVAKVTGAKTALTYAKAKGSSAKLTVDKKSGKVTVKKGTKKGTYTLKLKVSAKATANYKAATKTVAVKVRVK